MQMGTGTRPGLNPAEQSRDPGGADLRTFSQADLDIIAHELNHRPRKTHGYRTPAEVYADLLNSGDALTA
ncbi:hypothetical protein [Streptomyces sp. NEAU-YJ-81]|uniref:hypothetical protein n=1 Tax=Streptomyces sp. NEAU-YJ-81 TaxID=2820288 RepID=UPI001ABCC25D|nr:hypothetical protein [Streptomyces sp. NEAU-YJ-81]